jgi:hypothetical protein
MTVRRIALTVLIVLTGLVATPAAGNAIVSDHVSDTGVGGAIVPTGPQGCNPLLQRRPDRM